MDRARRTAAITRRKQLGASSQSPQSTPPDSASTSPVLLHASVSSAASPHSLERRSSRSLRNSFSFSPQGSTAQLPGAGLKKRSRTMDSVGDTEPDFDQDSPRKGGHTLRKRARVDYTFEHVDEEVVVPSSTSSVRTRNRRSDNSFDSGEMSALDPKHPGSFAVADATGSSRRNAAQSSVSGNANDQGDDGDEVQDTIEVGVSYSDVEASEARRGSHSSASSQAGSWKSAPTVPQLESASSKDLSNGAGEDEAANDGDAPRLVESGSGSGPGSVMPGSPGQDSVTESAADRAAADQATSELANMQRGTVVDDNDAAAVHEKRDADAAPGTYKNDDATAVQLVAALTSTTPPDDNSATLKNDDLPALTVTKAEEEESTKLDHQLAETPAPLSIQPESEPATADAALDAGHAEAVTMPDSVDAEVADVTDSQPLLQDDVEPMDMSVDVAEPPRSIHDASSSSNAESANSSADSKMEDIPEPLAPELTNTVEAAETSGSDLLKKEEAPSEEPKLSPTPTLAAEATKTEAPDTASTPAPAPVTKDPTKPSRPSQLGPSKPQPTPEGKWSFLTPYVDGEYVSYPEKKGRSDDDTGADDTGAEDKDTDKDLDNKNGDKDADKDGDKDANDVMEPMVEDNDDGSDPAAIEAPTPALNTPTRGSPVPDSIEPTAANSPAPAGDDGDDGDMSDADAPEQVRYFRYRKLRDPDDFINTLDNFENMSTTELYELLEAVNVSLGQWQTEWTSLGKIVDDYENSLRRRAADAKYESRTKSTSQHGINHEEPDFAVKGYKAREKELMSETRYLQSQDRIMAAAYGFEYDPHPSKIGKQNPEMQQVGIMTRGRSLRNQPRQTAKATETEEVTGKRQRKPVQLFDPAQEMSRSSTPVPARGRRRRNVNAADDDGLDRYTSSFNADGNSDTEAAAPRTRRRRGRGANAVDGFSTPRSHDVADPDDMGGSGRSGRRRGRQPVRYDDSYADFMDDDSAGPDSRQQRKRHMLTLKIPRSKHFSEPSSAITDNGDSRPSTASSDSTSHTAESSYSFRPKRQKRFLDANDESEGGDNPTRPRKRGKRSAPHGAGGLGGTESSFTIIQSTPDGTPNTAPRKVPKIKVVRNAGGDGRNGTPSSQGGGAGDGADDKPKDYKNMTKSEKMSASMKSEQPETLQPPTIRDDMLTTTPYRPMGKRKHGWRRGEAKSNACGEKGCSGSGGAKDGHHRAQTQGQTGQEGAQPSQPCQPCDAE